MNWIKRNRNILLCGFGSLVLGVFGAHTCTSQQKESEKQEIENLLDSVSRELYVSDSLKNECFNKGKELNKKNTSAKKKNAISAGKNNENIHYNEVITDPDHLVKMKTTPAQKNDNNNSSQAINTNGENVGTVNGNVYNCNTDCDNKSGAGANQTSGANEKPMPKKSNVVITIKTFEASREISYDEAQRIIRERQNGR